MEDKTEERLEKKPSTTLFNPELGIFTIGAFACLADYSKDDIKEDIMAFTKKYEKWAMYQSSGFLTT